MTLETLQKEVEIYKKNIDKVENHFDEFKSETVKLTGKYLDGFNNILENQSELRSNLRCITDEISKLRERALLLETFIKNIADENTLETIRKTKDFFEEYKELDLKNFKSSADTKLKFLVTAAGFFATTIVTLFGFVIAEIIK